MLCILFTCAVICTLYTCAVRIGTCAGQRGNGSSRVDVKHVLVPLLAHAWMVLLAYDAKGTEGLEEILHTSNRDNQTTNCDNEYQCGPPSRVTTVGE